MSMSPLAHGVAPMAAPLLSTPVPKISWRFMAGVRLHHRVTGWCQQLEPLPAHVPVADTLHGMLWSCHAMTAQRGASMHHSLMLGRPVSRCRSLGSRLLIHRGHVLPLHLMHCAVLQLHTGPYFLIASTVLHHAALEGVLAHTVLVAF